jgi:alcohol dehydrogenase class IV
MARAGFVFSTAKNIICEAGSSRRVGELISQTIGASASKCVMVVTDKGIKQAKLDLACIDGIRKQGYDVEVYSDVIADPPEKYILDAVKIAKSKNICAVVGLGGGSSMDVAKLVAYLAHSSCSQSLEELYGVGMGRDTRLPLLQVPTTAGTGSEVTPISIVTTGESSKKGVVMPQLLPDWAVLDGDLTLSVPPHVTAATGIDAMVHAIEAYTCRTKKNPLSDLYAREALRLLGGNIRAVCEDGSNSGARSDMLLGSMYAGMAFANSPVGAVHALAYPIGSLFHVPHGLSNSLMLP